VLGIVSRIKDQKEMGRHLTHLRDLIDTAAMCQEAIERNDPNIRFSVMVSSGLDDGDMGPTIVAVRPDRFLPVLEEEIFDEMRWLVRRMEEFLNGEG
jgi:hypothetical protein